MNLSDQRRPWVAAALLPGLLALAPASATAPQDAEVNRCQRPDGSSLYTDHGCAAVGAVARPAQANITGVRRVYRGGCARSVQELAFEVTTAIDAHDANRLANVYHWAGMSGRGGYAVMDRLEGVVKRPLIDVVPVRPAPPQPGLTVLRREWPGMATDDAEPASGATATSAAMAEAVQVAAAPPQPPARSLPAYRRTSRSAAPTALRLVQTLEDGTTPAETVFELHEHFGCVWIRG